MNSLYERQTLLDNFGAEGQEALAQAEVIVVGLGGLGCAAAQQLVSMGVGRLILVDGDIVSASNLSRQVLYNPSDIGRPKVVAAQNTLNAMRPECKITALQQFLNPAVCTKLFPKVKVVVDATDNFDAKLLINAAGVKFGVPIVWANAQKWEGQLACFDARKGPCYRCLLPIKPSSPGGDCNEVGVLGVVPNIIGALQALECVKIICEIAGITSVPKPIWGELQSFSFRDAAFFKTKVRRDPECSDCSQAAGKINLPEIAPPTCGLEKEYPVFPVSELKDFGQLCLVDVRERAEVEALPVNGALLLPLSELKANMPKAMDRIEAGKRYALFCKSGKRSRMAFDLISQEGISAENFLILQENAETLAMNNSAN